MKNRSRVGWIVGACVLVAAIAIVAVSLRPDRQPSAPPIPDLSQANAAAIRVVNQSREDLLRDLESSKAWASYGKVLMAHEWNTEAYECFQRAAKLDLENARWHYFSAILLEETDRQAALAEYEVANRIQPNYAPMHYRWGVLLLRVSRFEEAEAKFRRAAELAAEDPYPFVGLGRVAAARGNFSQAKEHFEQAATLEPSCREAVSELARVYFRLGDESVPKEQLLDAARLQTESAGMADPLLADVFREEVVARRSASMADEMLARGDLTGAEKAFQLLIVDRPDLSRPRLSLGLVYMKRNQIEKAIDAYREAVKLFPDDALAHHGLARALDANGEADAAIAAYRDCLRMKPDHGPAHFSLGLLLEKKDLLTEAIASYHKSIDADPGFGPAQLALGLAYQKAGRLDEAIRYIENAVRIRPGDPVPAGYLQKAKLARQQQTKP